MNIFTIDSENNITAHAGLPAGADESQSFTSQRELAKLIGEWPASRLVEAWNSFAGVAPFDDLKPVKKFTDRKSAIARIWKAVERLSPGIAPPAADVAPVREEASKVPSKGKGRDTARLGAKKPANVPREGSKQADVVAMMRRSEGLALEAIMQATAWQAHTVRGFVSGTLVKKLGFKVDRSETTTSSAATGSLDSDGIIRSRRRGFLAAFFRSGRVSGRFMLRRRSFRLLSVRMSGCRRRGLPVSL